MGVETRTGEAADLDWQMGGTGTSRPAPGSNNRTLSRISAERADGCPTEPCPEIVRRGTQNLSPGLPGGDEGESGAVDEERAYNPSVSLSLRD